MYIKQGDDNMKMEGSILLQIIMQDSEFVLKVLSILGDILAQCEMAIHF